MCRLVSRGLGVGAGGDGVRWWRYSVEEGPEERSKGS